jgi:hypothetical protein
MLNQSGMYSASCSRQNSELGVCSVYKAVKLAMNAVYEIGERDKAVNEDPYTNWWSNRTAVWSDLLQSFRSVEYSFQAEMEDNAIKEAVIGQPNWHLGNPTYLRPIRIS